MKIYCSNCGCQLHSPLRYWRGLLAWHLVCSWWLDTRLWWQLGIIPPFLATAGDCIYDARECACRDRQLIPESDRA